MANTVKLKDYYIDDKKFTKEIIDYIIQNNEWMKTHDKRLKPNDYIGECLLKISRRLAKSPNFINYSWSSDMIDEAVFLSCKYIDRFKPYIEEYDIRYDDDGNEISRTLISKTLKETGAFNYFTTIAYNAFRMTIINEKKKLTTKKRLLENDILNQAEYTLVKLGEDNYQVLSMYEGIINFNSENDDNYDNGYE